MIAYISSSSSASSPASCHSEGSENSFQSASSSVPSSPNSTHSDSNGNPKNGDLSSIEGILKNDRIDCSMKTSKSSAPGVTKSHSGVTSELSSFWQLMPRIAGGAYFITCSFGGDHFISGYTFHPLLGNYISVIFQKSVMTLIKSYSLGPVLIDSLWWGGVSARVSSRAPSYLLWLSFFCTPPAESGF